jgi:hypothetical protein
LHVNTGALLVVAAARKTLLMLIISCQLGMVISANNMNEHDQALMVMIPGIVLLNSVGVHVHINYQQLQKKIEKKLCRHNNFSLMTNSAKLIAYDMHDILCKIICDWLCGIDQLHFYVNNLI